MPKKSGQARVPKPSQWEQLYKEIAKNRHPIKNKAIMQISEKLGLRVQEIALLEIKEVAKLLGNAGSSNRNFKILEIMPLPASYTKGADALGRSKSTYKRKRVSFKVEEFENVVNQIVKLTLAGGEVSPSDYYPAVTKNKGKARDLPLVDETLRKSLSDQVQARLEKNPHLKPSDSLFITQKGGSYSPNTLQEHMAMMLRDWASIERATSHSGRRYVITDIIHHQKKSIKVAQRIAGHQNPSTTVIYEEPPEEEISNALANVGTNKSVGK